MSIAVPLYGFGASGGTGGTLTVTAPANVTVTVSKGGKTKTKNSGTGGVVCSRGLKAARGQLPSPATVRPLRKTWSSQPIIARQFRSIYPWGNRKWARCFSLR